MGYTTDFNGHFTLSRKLTDDEAKYLNQFSTSRRMRRDNNKLEHLPDPVRTAVGLPLGVQGEYYIGGGYEYDEQSVINHNAPPMGQPGLRCQWIPTQDGMGIMWDGGEKFYNYVEWANYIDAHFLSVWGIHYTQDTTVGFHGEDWNDVGDLIVNDDGAVESVKKKSKHSRNNFGF